ncbi:hypothetical protein [Clostridium thermobutyricum]|uniref:hypothetical protein n=1 Tax=Clostridium thermobutyricum TaxID=29372 RepID=UPI0018AB8F6E|nr:hypothetical protein [Clostridium thermobutyricum]
MNSYICKIINVNETTLVEIEDRNFNPISILNKTPIESTMIFLNTIFTFAKKNHVMLDNSKLLNICSEIFPNFKYNILNSQKKDIDITLNLIFDKKDFSLDNFISIKKDDYLNLYKLLMKSKFLRNLQSSKANIAISILVALNVLIMAFPLSLITITCNVALTLGVLVICAFTLFYFLKNSSKLKKYNKLHREQMDSWYRETTGKEPPTIKIVKG